MASDDRITLNVGGERFVTTRTTLTNRPGSMLATMFAANARVPTRPDADGSFFVDANPRVFEHVLDALRFNATPDVDAPPAGVLKSVWRAALDYYGLIVEPDAGGYGKRRRAYEDGTAKLKRRLVAHSSDLVRATIQWILESKAFGASGVYADFIVDIIVDKPLDWGDDDDSEGRRADAVAALHHLPAGSVQAQMSFIAILTTHGVDDCTKRFAGHYSRACGWTVFIEPVVKMDDASALRWPATTMQHKKGASWTKGTRVGKLCLRHVE